MEVKNNLAGRLYDILNAAQQQSPHETARKAWVAVFEEIEPDDTGALLKMLADLIDLVHETKNSIQRLQDVDQTLYLRPFVRIESLLSRIDLDAKWEYWRNQIDDATLQGLQFSADKLSRTSSFTQIPHGDLADLRKDLDELINSVIDSSLSQDVKILLLRNLEELRHVLIAYRISGIEGLQAEIERSLGSVLLHKDQIKASKTESEEHSVWTTIVDPPFRTVN
jgi:hypothetical protein